jgi:hypothetical protein
MDPVIEYVAVVCRIIVDEFVVDGSVDRMEYIQYYGVRF